MRKIRVHLPGEIYYLWAMIPIRRNPLLAVTVPALGMVLTLTGLYADSVWLLAPGILSIIFGALLIVNPAVVITPKEILIKNIFGLDWASFPHEGLEYLELVGDKLYIQHNEHRAHLPHVDPKMLHKGDWNNLKEQLKTAREMAQKEGFVPPPPVS